jgi:hypothetical protein
MEFFVRHGTHTLVKLALGALRVIDHSTNCRQHNIVVVFSGIAGVFGSELFALLEEKFCTHVALNIEYCTVSTKGSQIPKISLTEKAKNFLSNYSDF